MAYSLNDPIAQQAVLDGLNTYSVGIPTALGWDSQFSGAITLKQLGGGKMVGAFGYNPFQSSAYTACLAQKIYVATTGNDTTGTGAIGSPYRTADKAVTVGNATGAPYSVWIAAGIYERTQGGTLAISGSVGYPTQDVAFIAYGGTVEMGAFDTLTWTQDSTYLNVYNTTRSSFSRALSYKRYDENGVPMDMDTITAASSAAALARLNGMPAGVYVNGSTVSVSVFNGDVPSLSSIRPLLNALAVNYTTLTTPINIFMGPGDAVSQFEIWGTLTFACSTPFSSYRTLALKNVTSIGSSYTNTGARSFGIDSWNGLAYLENCTGFAAGTDAFNHHNSNGASKTMMLTLNCKAVRSGSPGQVSCNSWTLHENCIAIDIAGDYRLSQGGNIRNIGTSRALLAGTSVSTDRGDRGQGSGVPPVEVRVDDTAKIWMNRCSIKPNGSGWGLSCSSGGAILYANMDLTGIPVQDYGGTIAAYAD